MVEVFVVIAIIGVALNSIALGMKIRSDKKNSKEDEGTTTIANPHYCIHEKDWGAVLADIKNIKNRLDKLNV